MKKISFLILFFVILLVFLTEDINRSLKSFNVVVVGNNPYNDWSPFSHIEENGYVTGFEIDFMNEISKIVGFKIVWKKLDFDLILNGIKEDTIDLGISTITITPDRQKEMLFSEPYFATSTRIVINKDEDEITGINKRLKNKKVAVRSQTINESLVKKYSPLIILFDETDMWNALLEKRIDAIVNDRLILEHFIKKHDTNDQLRIVGSPVNTSDFGIITNKKNKKLIKKINNAIQQLKEDGKFDALYNKWFLKKFDDHKEHHYNELNDIKIEENITESNNFTNEDE